MLHLFGELALGTKFRYAKSKKIWTKIGANLIAEWDETLKTDTWIAQQICCFSDMDDLAVYVNVL
jgi:hypothetical protein